jgi:hypothetical protein
MHQTIYIDVDEEITGILDRVRQEQVMEIYLVVPKGAMLINSIINLKLLKKEAEKMGKNVVIVAPNDKRSRNIVERSGIRVEAYNEQINKNVSRTTDLSIRNNLGGLQQTVNEASEETQRQIQRERMSLGSNSFFSGNPTSVITTETNSKINTSENESFTKKQIATAKPPVKEESSFGGGNKEDAGFGYFNDLQKHNLDNDKSSSNQRATDKKSFFVRHKFLLGGGVILAILSLVGPGWFFANYPKLEIVIHPLSKEIDQEVKIIAQEGNEEVDLDNKKIPGEYLEMSVEKTMEFDATGSKIVDKNASLAEGTVTIYNHFSDKPQPLVKTTRVLSKKDKKLFRLTKTIVVPGMNGEEPGKIEISVRADKPGKEFNIGPDEFTIEGFKSKPEKYKKFKVVSSEPMTGGDLSDDAKTKKVVTKKDLDLARQKTIEALDEDILTEVKKRLNPNQEVIEDSIVKEIVSSKSSRQEDAIADKFSYTVVYKLKLIAFNKNDARQIITEAIREDLQQNYELDNNFQVEYKRGIADLDKKTLTIYANVTGKAWFKVDREELKRAIAGTDGEVTKQSLNRDAGVDTAELKPTPAWLNKSPKNLNKITIRVIRQE